MTVKIHRTVKTSNEDRVMTNCTIILDEVFTVMTVNKFTNVSTMLTSDPWRNVST